MVEAAPAPSFKMSQPDLLLEFLIFAFDPPSQLGNVDELTERDVFRKRRQPIFDRLVLAIHPCAGAIGARHCRGSLCRDLNGGGIVDAGRHSCTCRALSSDLPLVYRADGAE